MPGLTDVVGGKPQFKYALAVMFWEVTYGLKRIDSEGIANNDEPPVVVPVDSIYISEGGRLWYQDGIMPHHRILDFVGSNGRIPKGGVVGLPGVSAPERHEDVLHLDFETHPKACHCNEKGPM